MVEMEINRILSQMRELSGEIRAQPQAQPNLKANGAPEFGDLLRNSIESVNSQQAAAETLLTRFESGATDVSVAEVMISMQKASLSFQAMNEVRNRLVDAYQQIMNMPI